MSLIFSPVIAFRMLLVGFLLQLQIVAVKTLPWPVSLSSSSNTLKNSARYNDDYTPDVPRSFDCDMRKSAYEYGKHLLPRLGAFEDLFIALGLNMECEGDKVEVEPWEQNFGKTARKLEVQQQQQQQKKVNQQPSAISNSSKSWPKDAVFVAPVPTSSQQGCGKINRPFTNIQTAIDYAAEHTESKVVVLRGGTYYIKDTIRFTSKHSGVLLIGYENETPVISGGVKLEVKWNPYDVDKDSGRNIYVADLRGQNVEDIPGLQLNGSRATRARYPNLEGGIEVSPMYGSMMKSSDAIWTPPNFERFGKVKYYTEKDPTRWRNDTTVGQFNEPWFQRYKIGIGGLCSVYDPPVSYWCAEKVQGGGAFAYRTPTGITPNKHALPNAPYKNPEDAVFFVWRPARWANWMFEVSHYDAETNNFTFGHGGFQGARGSNKGGDWFVENVFEELDTPGEFFYDKATQHLYLFHNGTGPPDPDTVVVSPQHQVLVNISGNQWDPVRNVKLEGIKYMAASYTYMNPHGVPSAGDWALERFAALFLEGTEGITIDRCIVERVDGNGIMLSGYNRNATIENSDIAFVGGTAIALWGRTNETEGDNHPYAGVDGTDGNHPRFTTVRGCFIREVGLYEKQSSFFMQAKTPQTTIEGNVFFNGPRAGINFNDGFGGGDVIAHNLVFSTCRESGDHDHNNSIESWSLNSYLNVANFVNIPPGPFNSWDRQPFLTTVRTGKPSMRMAWRHIHHNFFIDNYSPQENVDNDDGSGWYKTHDNFLVYGDAGLKNDFGGHDNWHFRNIYAYVGAPLGIITTQLPGHEDHFFENKVVMRRESLGALNCKGPSKTVIYGNEYFTKNGKLQECGSDFGQWQAKGNDKGSKLSTYPPDGEIISWAKATLGF